MSPIFIRDGKILITNNKLRGCCCGGRWRISAVKVAAFLCAEEGEKGEEIDLTIPADQRPVGQQELCGNLGGPYYTGDIGSAEIIIDGTTYYELLQVPRSVNVEGWINEFADGVNQEYPNPCSSETFLLMDFKKVCLPPDKTVVDEDITKSYARICPPPPLDDITVSYLDCMAGNVIYEFTSTVTGNEGSIGIEAPNAPGGCLGEDSLPATIIRTKKVQYTVNEIPDPDNAGATKCCLTNPVQLSYGNDEQGQPILENIECYVLCCGVNNNGEVITEQGDPIKTYWEVHMKLQVLCTDGGEWQDIENPSSLTAPTENNPGTGDPGVGESDNPETPETNEATSSWLIAKCFTCNSLCLIDCFEGEDDDHSIKANLDIPPFLDMDEESICPA
jgi:hypothetical protein